MEQRYQGDEGVVSIVTPVFNGELHLPAMLDSVLGQTWQQIEMILVDDGSTDKTLQVAESYRGRFAARGYRFRIVHTEHQNASAAINRGLPYVRGEYLIWPDSDDVLEPESVRRRVEFLQANPEYRCVRTLGYYFDAGTGKRIERADEKRGDLSKEDLFWDILEFRTFVCCGCYMLRAGDFFEIYPGRHIPEYDVGQNFQMLLPFMFFHKCPTIREELYGVYVREGSHSRRKLTQAQEEKKYGDYEDLLDEIAGICHISDKASKKRIARWKARRRYQIALKYKRKDKMVSALYQLYRCGEFELGKIMKDSLWILLGDSRIGKKFYLACGRLYRKLRSFR